MPKETSLNAKGNVFECDFPPYCIKSYLKALKACMRKLSADNSIFHGKNHKNQTLALNRAAVISP